MISALREHCVCLVATPMALLVEASMATTARREHVGPTHETPGMCGLRSLHWWFPREQRDVRTAGCYEYAPYCYTEG